MPREKVKNIFPPSIFVIFEHLVDYVAGKDAREVAKDYEARVKQLEAELEAVKAKSNGAAKEPVKPEAASVIAVEAARIAEEALKRGPGRPRVNG
jgi:hypothetical protein